MSNFGIRHLRVVNPYEAAFREARSAVGASELLRSAEEYASVGEAVADCALVVGTTAGRDRELQHPLRRLDEGARIIGKHLASGPVALLFGSEKHGLSNQELSHCHWLLQVPTRAEHVSMNLGQAVAVCLYALVRELEGASRPAKVKTERSLKKSKNAQRARNAKHTQPEKTGPATAGELERITEVLLEALGASGYLNSISSASNQEKLRRHVRRLNLSADDAEIWLGMLRQIVWKIHSQKGPAK